MPNRSHPKICWALVHGGMGSFELVSRNPDYFASAFPICGGAITAWAKAMSKSLMWIFHGEKDKVVSANYSKEIFTALKEINAAFKLTLHLEVFHYIWHKGFGDLELMQWLFSNQKNNRSLSKDQGILKISKGKYRKQVYFLR
ncbi:MAG: hypothetical protein CMC93_04360 [Flavobacteriaceae bacterium]|nr:hypothetical protein [Flavobacteriaceae bacterium]